MITKKMKSLLAGLALTVSSFGASAAVWTQTIDFNPDVFVPPTYSWTHDLTTAGFNAATDLVTGFTLNVTIKDDRDSFFAPLEWAFADLPGLVGDRSWFSPIGSNSAGPSFEGLLSLNANGLLSVSVGSLLGDFLIDKSSLTATGLSDVRGQVPEPGVLALVGIGLLGIGFARRSQRLV
jgi:hypothetical protein